MDDSSPRPTLVHFALSTLILGLCAAALVLVGVGIARGRGADPTLGLYCVALIVSQGLACFGRLRWAAWACTALTAVAGMYFASIVIEVTSARIAPFRWQVVLRLSLLTVFFAVATLANGQWARKLSKAEAKPGFILRYSLAELATILTILCAVAAVVAKMFRDG